MSNEIRYISSFETAILFRRRIPYTIYIYHTYLSNNRFYVLDFRILALFSTRYLHDLQMLSNIVIQTASGSGRTVYLTEVGTSMKVEGTYNKAECCIE